MTTATASFYTKHKAVIDNAVKAIHDRGFYAQYPEHPKPYGEDAPAKGLAAFEGQLNKPFEGLLQGAGEGKVGAEVSPYTGKPLGIQYPSYGVNTLVKRAEAA